jgi:hypothetical protein
VEDLKDSFVDLNLVAILEIAIRLGGWRNMKAELDPSASL